MLEKFTHKMVQTVFVPRTSKLRKPVKSWFKLCLKFNEVTIFPQTCMYVKVPHLFIKTDVVKVFYSEVTKIKIYYSSIHTYLSYI